MEIFNIIFQFIDILLSGVVSLINILRSLWRELLLGALILLAVLVLLRLLRAVKGRRTFIGEIRRAAKENGITLTFNRPACLSLLWNFGGYDIEFKLLGTLYRLKFYPWIPTGRAIHLRSATDTVWQGRLSHNRALAEGRVRGVRVKLKYDNTPADGIVNLLVFSPTPIAVTERNSGGAVWELDTENGGLFDGVYLFTDEILASRLPRLIDGYIDELVHTDE